MKKGWKNFIIALSLPAGCFSFTSCGSESEQKVAASPIDRPAYAIYIRDWPKERQALAKTLVQKYGEPKEVTEKFIAWYDKGEFKRIQLYKESVDHDFPSPHTDFLEQTINYKVPPDKFDELAKFDGSIIVRRTEGEISAKCNREEMNILALNLANDVAKGRKTVEQARKLLIKNAKSIADGDNPEISEAIQFNPQEHTADKDKPGKAPSAKAARIKTSREDIEKIEAIIEE